MVQKLGGNSVNMFSDSRFIVGQVNGELEGRVRSERQKNARILRPS